MQNVPSVAAMGYSDAQIEAMWARDYSSFPEDEQAVIELADEIALNNRDGELSRRTSAKLRRHFSEEQILQSWPVPRA